MVVGVDNTGGRPALRAAASGARRVAEWLNRDGYEVTCIADDIGTVTRAAIFAAVEAFVRRDDIEKLVFYFAGHGLLNGSNEIWLLSGAPADPGEAIDGTASVELARASDIPHVIFISDACRSVGTHPSAARVRGSGIFPNIEPGDVTPEVDIFFATRPGQLAYEMAFEDALEVEGVFSRELHQAHINPPREKLVSGRGTLGVPNRWLKQVVPRRVDAEAQRRSVALRQLPELRLECDETAFLASAMLTKGQIEAGSARSERFLPDPASIVQDVFGSDRGSHSFLTTDGMTREEAAGFRNTLGRLYEGDVGSDDFDHVANLMALGTVARPRYPTGAVVAVLGTENAQLHGTQSGTRIFGDLLSQKAGSMVRYLPTRRRATNVAVMFGQGRGTVVPALRGYQCQVIIADNVVSSITYTPLPFTKLWDRYEGNRAEIGELRSIAAAASDHGLLDLRGRGAEALADRVRTLKIFDPTLGIIAGVAYASAGRRDGAASVLSYSRKDLGIDLLDLWLLAGAPPSELSLFPACPLTTAGWSYLNIHGVVLPQALEKAGRLGSFWTTFADGEMPAIIAMLAEGDIR